LFLAFSSTALASISQSSYQHTNLLRTIDLTKSYLREITALVLENTSNTTQTEYYWGIPHNLVPKLSYLEIKEKKTGATGLFPVEFVQDEHPYFLRP
jgi:oligosaccharyltransferase complex subunit alpha (ribophorin I)